MSDIKNALMKLTKTVTKTSSDILRTTKLSMTLASEEDRLKAIYMDIGKKVHEIYQYGGSLGKFFDEKHKEITDVESKITDIKNQLDMAKGLKSCPKCGKSIDKNADFCPKCGLRLEGSPPPADELLAKEALERAEEESRAPKMRICAACRAENEPGTKFCLKCGRMLN
jgi:hypothetical protein